jgi:hypothetical protein
MLHDETGIGVETEFQREHGDDAAGLIARRRCLRRHDPVADGIGAATVASVPRIIGKVGL